MSFSFAREETKPTEEGGYFPPGPVQTVLTPSPLQKEIESLKKNYLFILMIESSMRGKLLVKSCNPQ